MTITLSNISKSFSDKIVLKDINYTFNDKNLYFLVGPSGKGKSTILSILGLLDTPTSGDILFNNKIITNNEKDDFIKEHISFVFQDYNLFDNLNVYDNFSLYVDNKEELIGLLNKFNLDISLKTKVKYLSGGEKQRLSILRALIKGGDILLFDEPTGNLDKENSILVFDMIKQISKDKLCIVVSHDIDLAISYGDYILNIDDYTLNEYNDSFILDFKNEGSKALNQLNLYLNSNIDSFILTYDKEEIIINKDNQLEALNKIYQENKDQSIKVKIKAKTNKTINNNNEYKIEKHPLKIKQFLAKYSLKNFTYKVGRAILSVVLMTFSLSVLFSQFSFLFYNKNQTIQNAFLANDIQYVYSNPENGYVVNKLIKENSNVYPKETIKIVANIANLKHYFYANDFPLDIYIVKDKFIYNDIEYEPLKNGKIMLSDFAKEFLKIPSVDIVKSAEKRSLYNQGIVGVDEYGINFDIDYSDSIKTTFNINDITDVDYDMARKYSFGILDYDCFLNQLDQKIINQSYWLNMSSYDISYLKPYNNETLYLGSIPKNKNDVVLSLNSHYLDEEDINYYVNEYYNKKIIVHDIDIASEESLKYAFNLYDYCKEINIVGFSLRSDTSVEASYLISQDLYNELKGDILNTIDQCFYLKNAEKTVNTLQKYNISFTSDRSICDRIVVQINNFTDYYIVDLQLVFISLSLIMVLFYALSLILFVIQLIKDNFHQLATMKSFGINTKQIFFSSYLTILIPSVIGFVLSVIFGVLVIYIFNIVFSKMVILDATVNYYNVLLPVSWAFVIPMILSIIIPFIVCLFFIRRFNKIQPYDALKRFN